MPMVTYKVMDRQTDIMVAYAVHLKLKTLLQNHNAHRCYITMKDTVGN